MWRKVWLLAAWQYISVSKCLDYAYAVLLHRYLYLIKQNFAKAFIISTACEFTFFKPYDNNLILKISSNPRNECSFHASDSADPDRSATSYLKK